MFAFFPCTRFEDQIQVYFRGDVGTIQSWTDQKKLEYDLKLHAELSENYEVITKLVLIAIDRGFKLVIENPYSVQHYLRNFWALKPAMIDKDRREDGDYYRKPTQYFFVNHKPTGRMLFEPIDDVETMRFRDITVRDGIRRQTLRSMIHPQYANRFIRQYLL